MARSLYFDTTLEQMQGRQTREAFRALCPPSAARPGMVIGHCLDVEITSEGRLSGRPRQWFCLARPVGFELVEFRALPDDQKAAAAIAACHLLEDTAFEEWIDEGLVRHMRARGWDRAGYGIFTIAGGLLAVHENALSTLSQEVETLTDDDMSREICGAISRDLSHHARLEIFHQMGVLFTLYHMSESAPESDLSVFFEDLRIGPAHPGSRH